MLDKIIFKIYGGVKFARSKGVCVGENCRILTGKFGSEPWLISIGDNVTISSEVLFLNHDGAGWLVNDDNGRRYRYAKISIGNHCFVGARAILMPGVSIGSRCIVGAGTVVSKSIPSGYVVAGNPVKTICTYDDFEQRARETWKSESDMRGENRYERVNSILDAFFKKNLTLRN